MKSSLCLFHCRGLQTYYLTGGKRQSKNTTPIWIFPNVSIRNSTSILFITTLTSLLIIAI